MMVSWITILFAWIHFAVSRLFYYIHAQIEGTLVSIIISQFHSKCLENPRKPYSDLSICSLIQLPDLFSPFSKECVPIIVFDILHKPSTSVWKILQRMSSYFGITCHIGLRKHSSIVLFPLGSNIRQAMREILHSVMMLWTVLRQESTIKASSCNILFPRPSLMYNYCGIMLVAARLCRYDEIFNKLYLSLHWNIVDGFERRSSIGGRFAFWEQEVWPQIGPVVMY